MDGFLSWQGNQEGIPGQGRSSLLDGEGGEAASVCGKEILGYPGRQREHLAWRAAAISFTLRHGSSKSYTESTVRHSDLPCI